MQGNEELLNYIYQNSQMGIETIDQLTDIVKDADFNEHLQAQLREYRSINGDAKEILHRRGSEEKGIGPIDKTMVYLMINAKTLTDKSASHIAQMMIQGSTMGIIEATKNINRYEGAQDEIIDLAKRLLHMEENNVEQLKKFLR